MKLIFFSFCTNRNTTINVYKSGSIRLTFLCKHAFMFRSRAVIRVGLPHGLTLTYAGKLVVIRRVVPTAEIEHGNGIK